ncbi:MAG: hypothetical protein AMXMBFR47_34930 [Planctomycetota bacterium]
MDAFRIQELRVGRPLAICLVLGGITALAYALVLALDEIPDVRSCSRRLGIKYLPIATEAVVAYAWALPVQSAIQLVVAVWALFRPRMTLLVVALLLLIAAWTLNAAAAYSLTMPFRWPPFTLTNQ